jgi:hypothetical protein
MWDVAPCRMVETDKHCEVLTATIIRVVMMDAESTSGMSVIL